MDLTFFLHSEIKEPFCISAKIIRYISQSNEEYGCLYVYVCVHAYITQNHLKCQFKGIDSQKKMFLIERKMGLITAQACLACIGSESNMKPV